MTIETVSREETIALGRALGAACSGGETVLLSGEIGAGKTTFTGGIAAGLDVSVPVTSPTFVILREYEGRLSLYHFDFYRLEGVDRAVDLEFDEYAQSGGVLVVEWPALAHLGLDDVLHVALSADEYDRRTLDFEPTGPHHAALLARFAERIARS